MNDVQYEDVIVGIPVDAREIKMIVHTKNGSCRCYKILYNEAEIIEARQRFLDCCDGDYPYTYTPTDLI